MNGAELIVKTLEAHGITHVFGIPGAKVDSVFIALLDSPIELVLCRHEQNAAFMAQAMGRMTGTIGVCIATSGPGVTNLVTGLATATTEGDPVLAIGGEVSTDDRYKHCHQSLDAISLMEPVTKYAKTALNAHDLPEVLGNAIRAAEHGRRGAAFLGLPKDIGLGEINDCEPSDRWGQPIRLGAASADLIAAANKRIGELKQPMLLLGLQTSDPSCSEALMRFVRTSGLPYASTFQAAGRWVAPEQFVGRLGLFRNQPADRLLDASDGVICIGFDPVEYDASIWNSDNNRSLISVDVEPPDQDRAFLPDVELVGDLSDTLQALSAAGGADISPDFLALAAASAAELTSTAAEGASMTGMPMHPLRVVHELHQVITPETTVALDVGSHYIWMNRYLPTEHARQVLVSNGQQTLGVALPWAIAANLVHPDQPVIAVCGDGGFLFTATELETAVRIGCRFVLLIWDSQSYDMVEFQEKAHYGRVSGIKLGHYDAVKFAESFGCKGYVVTDAEAFRDVLLNALQQTVPAVIQIPIDYSDNIKLMQDIHQSFVH